MDSPRLGEEASARGGGFARAQSNFVRPSGAARQEEKFMGVKLRRHASLAANAAAMKGSVKGDYLSLASNHAILKALSKQGDQNVLFADTLAKVNRQNRIVPRLMVITESAVCIFECHTFRLKRRILLKYLESLNLSEFADNFFALIIPEEYPDLLLVSTRKSEIVTVLVEAIKRSTGRDLQVHFSNSFPLALDPDTQHKVDFTPLPNGVSTKITRM